MLVSPKESAGLTGVVLKAIDAKICNYLDRNIEADKYTQFIGGDNVLIGRKPVNMLWNYLAVRAKQKVTCGVMGGKGTQPAHDRHDGFMEYVGKESGIKSLLQPMDCDWKQQKAYEVMSTALKSFDHIDLLYGHNDPEAYGAYLAAKDAGREKEIKFLGIDALPDEGVTWEQRPVDRDFPVCNARRGGSSSRIKIVNGEKVEKKITLPTIS